MTSSLFAVQRRCKQYALRHYSFVLQQLSLVARCPSTSAVSGIASRSVGAHQQQFRSASSASSTRWKTRQATDHFAREARVHGLKSRAAFKLLQINDKYKIFKKGNTVVDLGYAPGSWSQVAISRTQPNGRVIGVDILPAQPPRGVSTIQGDFLSPEIQAEVRSYVLDHDRGRAKKKSIFSTSDETQQDDNKIQTTGAEGEAISEPSYLELERQATADHTGELAEELSKLELEHMSRTQRDEAAGRVVDVVLSDMCEPWEQTSGFGKRSISDPYFRMMNTSGTPFRDHAGSMVCACALGNWV